MTKTELLLFVAQDEPTCARRVAEHFGIDTKTACAHLARHFHAGHLRRQPVERRFWYQLSVRGARRLAWVCGT